MKSNPQCEHICHVPKYVLKRFIGALAMQACCSVTRNTVLNVLCNQHGRLITLHKLPLRSIMHHIVITYAAVAQQIAPSLLRILACCLSKQQCKATAYLFLELIKVQLQWSFLLCDLLQYPNQQKLLIHLL